MQGQAQTRLAEVQADLRHAQAAAKQEQQLERLAQLHSIRREIRSLEPKVRRWVAQIARADGARQRIRDEVDGLNNRIGALQRAMPEFPAAEDLAQLNLDSAPLVEARNRLLGELQSIQAPDRSAVLAEDRRLSELRVAERNLVQLLRDGELGWRSGLSRV